MIGTTKRVAICAALLALGGMTVACGDDDGGTPDAGRMDAGRDAGSDEDEDAGPEDAGQDAGPPDAGPPPPFVRLAHLISNGPAVHVCINAVGVPTSRLITVNTTTGAPTSVRYRGVSPYTDALTLPQIPHVVRVYDAADIASGMCPASTATDPAPIITQEIDIAMLEGGAYHTVAAIGLAGGTGAQAPQLAIISDDLSDPETAGNAKIRLVHALTNLPVPVDVCYDPDFAIVAGVPMPGEEPAVSLFANEAFIGADPAVTDVQAIDYIEVSPVTTGFIFVYPRGATATDCATANPFTTMGTLRIPVPLPVPPAGTPDIPGSLSAGATFDAGEVVSVFAVGDAAFATVGAPTPCTMDSDCAAALPAGHTCNPLVGVCTHPRGPSAVPYVDNFEE